MFRIFVLTLSLIGCGQPQVKKTNIDASAANASDKILILNGTGSSFTMVHDIHSDPKVTPNISLSRDPHLDGQPCDAPNHMVLHGASIYVTCSRTHNIQVINAATLKYERSIPLLANHNPMSLVFVKEDLAFTQGWTSNMLLAINPQANLPIDKPRFRGNLDLSTLPLQKYVPGVGSPRPEGIALKGDLGFLALNHLTDTYNPAGPGHVLIFNIKTLQVLKLIKTNGTNTRSVYTGKTNATANYLYIVSSGSLSDQAHANSGTVDVYDMQKGEIIRTLSIPGAPSQLELAPDNRAYLSNAMENVIHSFNAATFESYPAIDLKGFRCDGPVPAFPSFISSILVAKDKLLATDFSTNCMMIVDRNSGIVQGQVQTGGGPGYMIAL